MVAVSYKPFSGRFGILKGMTGERTAGKLRRYMPSSPLTYHSVALDSRKRSRKAAVFLASEDASFIAGVELFVDGGTVQV